VRIERWISTLPLRWRSLVRRGRVERDLDDEIHDHLESQIEELVARGLEPAEAERIVRDRFGHVDLAKERCRETRHMYFVDALLQDLRYAARTLRRNRGFAATTILTLALGIGANTAVFSLVDGILLSRLPYPDPERLIGINATYYKFGLAALIIYTSAFVCEALRSGINSVSAGQAEAARAIGLTFTQSLTQVVLPQAFRTSIPPVGSVIIAMFKNSAVVGAFGVGGDLFSVGESLTSAQGYAALPVLTGVAVGYLLITLPAGMALSMLERKVAIAR